MKAPFKVSSLVSVTTELFLQGKIPQHLNSFLVIQNFKIASIIIGLIVESFKDFGSIKKDCFKIYSNSFRIARVKNQCENKLKLKNAAFSFR